jgi:hypothetical protein
MIALALAGGCFLHGGGAERRELTMQELAVRVLPGEMHVSIQLQKSCQPVGTIDRHTNEYDIRVQTVANGGNVAQLINQVSYSRTENNYTTTFAATDVRYWRCPGGPQPPPPGPPPPPPPTSDE